MKHLIAIHDLDDNESIVNLNNIEYIVKLSDRAVITLCSGNYIMVCLDTYDNIRFYLKEKGVEF